MLAHPMAGQYDGHRCHQTEIVAELHVQSMAAYLHSVPWCYPRLIAAVMSMYTGAKIVVRTVYGNTECFEVKVGMHQGSALSPLLFVIVMEAISREFRVALP